MGLGRVHYQIPERVHDDAKKWARRLNAERPAGAPRITLKEFLIQALEEKVARCESGETGGPRPHSRM